MILPTKPLDFCQRIRHNYFEYGPLAQLVEHLTFNQGATGSNPVGPALFKKIKILFKIAFLWYDLNISCVILILFFLGTMMALMLRQKFCLFLAISWKMSQS